MPTPVRRRDHESLEGPVSDVSGIGPRGAERLRLLGIASVKDLLFHFPRRYRDLSAVVPVAHIRPGDEISLVVTVTGVRPAGRVGGRSLVTVDVADESGRLRCAFFNQPWVGRSLSPGARVAIAGRARSWSGELQMTNPDWEPLGTGGGGLSTMAVVPVYPAVEGVGQRWLRRHARRAAEEWAPQLGDALPPDLRDEEGLMSRPEAVQALHAPASLEHVAAARRRLAVDQLLARQLAGLRRRQHLAALSAPDLSAGLAHRDRVVRELPFPLTCAQERCIEEIGADMARGAPMRRLLQGDVGSGKTAVAAAAIAQCVGAGYQSALMAPTAILAAQHARGMEALLAGMGFHRYVPSDEGKATTSTARAEGVVDRPAYVSLTGSMTPHQKEVVRAAAAAGDVDLVIGTHALIQDGVEFARLGLAVIDEQHRFGVLQRAALPARSGRAPSSGEPHVLVMTATPIPRTLAMVLHADLETSIIDELPTGRQPIRTVWLLPGELELAYAAIRDAVSHGRQAYVVTPLVEESEALDTPSAEQEHERLRAEVFSDFRLGLIHGRMAAKEKENVMGAFQSRQIDVLVATTVVEVGVDVPNATVMLIDGAERFGLAQLHQLRGRVGRGSSASMCFLHARNLSAGAAGRLRAMVRTTDGMLLAETDLALRGPGDDLGTAQAGHLPALRLAAVAPREAMEQAHRIAHRVFGEDPELERLRHAPLRDLVNLNTGAHEEAGKGW